MLVFVLVNNWEGLSDSDGNYYGTCLVTRLLLIHVIILLSSFFLPATFFILHFTFCLLHSTFRILHSFPPLHKIHIRLSLMLRLNPSPVGSVEPMLNYVAVGVSYVDLARFTSLLYSCLRL
jgi:hypothetical protein